MSGFWLVLGCLLSAAVCWTLQPYLARFAKWQTQPHQPRPTQPKFYCMDCKVRTVGPGICRRCDEAREDARKPRYGNQPRSFPLEMRDVFEQRHGPLEWQGMSENTWDRLATTRTVFFRLHTGDPGPHGLDHRAAGSAIAVAVPVSRYGTTLRYPGFSSGTSWGSRAPSWTNEGCSETITHFSAWFDASGDDFAFSASLTLPQPWVATNTFTMIPHDIEVRIRYDPDLIEVIKSW